jgi:chromosome segregation ATPase
VRSRSSLVDSILQQEGASAGELSLSLSPPEQQQLWHEFKALTADLESTEGLVAQLRESLSSLVAERSQLRQQLDGRNRLVAELFMPSSGEADSDDLGALLGVMRSKVRTAHSTLCERDVM